MKIAHIFANKNFECRGQKFIAKAKEKGHEVVPILKEEGSYLKFILKSLRTLKKEKPDWIHAHRISGYVPAILYKLYNQKVGIVYDKHDIHWLDFIFDRLLFFADQVLVCSELHYSKISQLTRKVLRIPNFSDFAPVTDKVREGVRKELGLNYGDTFILFQGSIVKTYGLSMLIEAMKEIQDKTIKAVVIGWKDEDYWNEIKDTLPTNITYAGSRNYDEMNKYVGSADIGAVLFQKSKLTKFGDPAKLYEFMNCKVPIIATDLPYLRQAITFSDSGIIIKNKNELKDAILKLSKKQERIKFQMRWNTTWSNISDEYLSLFN